jgi:ribosomal protein S24E
MAWTEFEEDFRAMRILQEQAATNVNMPSRHMPVVGFLVTLQGYDPSSSDAGPSSASDLPPGLTLNRVISDYLRAMGNFILRHLQEVDFGSDLSMEDVQWCVTVPSIWSHNPRQQMKSCMVDAGLVVGGSNGINASTHPVIMVLQTDAASYRSCEKLSLQRGEKVFLANIGYDTTDVVLQEWVGCEGAYNFKVFKDLMHSSSGLGGTKVEKQIIELLRQKYGPTREYLRPIPEYKTRLLENSESGIGRLKLFTDSHLIRLASGLLQEWQGHETPLVKDIQNILNPIVEAHLDFIAAQLSQTTGIRVMVVVHRLGGLSDLETRIRHKFGDRVGEIVVAEANELTTSAAAVRIAQDCFPGFDPKTFDLVVEVIDNALIKTRQMDNQDWANNNCVRINQGQCNHLANKLAEMKDWLLQEHQNSEIILTWAMHRVLLHLLRVVKRADLLVRECCKSEDWGKAAVLQAGNEEAFVGILHDLKWWCTHFLNLTILSGLNSSHQIQSLGDADKLNQFEPDHILARRAALDREELVANLMQLKRHDKSDVMVDHLLDRYSQQASDQSTKVHFPLPFWNTQDDKTLPIVKHLGHGAYGAVFESVWLGLPCAQKVFKGAENVSFKKEADILGTLKHPNIIQLFCCTTDAKSCSLVMELMSTDLRNFMDEKMKDPKHVVPFSLPVAVDIMLQVARGLKYMHEQRVGHRDIKSSNILVNPTSVPELAEMGYIDVKVADFGFAKAKLMSSTATKQTKNIGTKSYMAPELYTQVSHKNCINDDL